MNLLLDQDVYAVTARFLGELGHEVVCAHDAGLAGATDIAILDWARQQGRLLVTRDRDFGGLVFLRGAGPGVVYLRVSPSTLHAVHKELAVVLGAYPLDELRRAFVVVEPGRHRFRRLN